MEATRYIRLDKKTGPCEGYSPVIRKIPEDLSDDGILEQASQIIGGPVERAAVIVYEINGDVRLYYDGSWEYLTRVIKD